MWEFSTSGITYNKKTLLDTETNKRAQEHIMLTNKASLKGAKYCEFHLIGFRKFSDLLQGFNWARSH